MIRTALGKILEWIEIGVAHALMRGLSTTRQRALLQEAVVKLVDGAGAARMREINCAMAEANDRREALDLALIKLVKARRAPQWVDMSHGLLRRLAPTTALGDWACNEFDRKLEWKFSMNDPGMTPPSAPTHQGDKP